MKEPTVLRKKQFDRWSWLAIAVFIVVMTVASLLLKGATP